MNQEPNLSLTSNKNSNNETQLENNAISNHSIIPTTNDKKPNLEIDVNNESALPQIKKIIPRSRVGKVEVDLRKGD